MLQTRRVALLAMAAASVAWAQTGQERAETVGRDLVGELAPRLVVRTIDGDSIDLGALYDKQAVYLKFWATWCVPCRAQMGHFEEAYETAGPNLAVVGVNIGLNDSVESVRKAIAEDELTMPMVIDDGRLAAAFNLRVTPQHIVIGRGGRIEYVSHLADERLDRAVRDAQVTAVSDSSVGTTPESIRRYGVGDTLPDFATQTLAGERFRALDVGRPTVLVFLSPWCEYYLAESRPAVAAGCKQAREQVAELAGAERRIRWLGVSLGLWSTPDELREYEAEYQPGIPLTMDESGEWFRAFEVTHMPTIVIADAAGVIVKRMEGYDAGLGAEVERAIAIRSR